MQLPDEPLDEVDTVVVLKIAGKLKVERIGSRSDRKFKREDVAVFYLDRAIQRYLGDKQA